MASLSTLRSVQSSSTSCSCCKCRPLVLQQPAAAHPESAASQKKARSTRSKSLSPKRNMISDYTELTKPHPCHKNWRPRQSPVKDLVSCLNEFCRRNKLQIQVAHGIMTKTITSQHHYVPELSTFNHLNTSFWLSSIILHHQKTLHLQKTSSPKTCQTPEAFP